MSQTEATKELCQAIHQGLRHLALKVVDTFPSCPTCENASSLWIEIMLSCLRFTTYYCESVEAIHVISRQPVSKFGWFPSSQDTIQLPRDLGEIGEFQDLPPEPLEELSRLMKLRLYVPQQVILQQGLVDLNGVDRVPLKCADFLSDLNQLESTAPDLSFRISYQSFASRAGDDLYEIVILQRGRAKRFGVPGFQNFQPKCWSSWWHAFCFCSTIFRSLSHLCRNSL